MSAAAQTKIFGMRVAIDPKILIVGLLALAGLLFWINSRGDEETGAPAVHEPATSAPVIPALTTRPRSHAANRHAVDLNRGTLRIRAIDATRGDIDPTLRLDLLARLQSIPPTAPTRNLFEMGPPPAATIPISGPPITPKPIPAPAPPHPLTPAEQPLNIPLKFYGFVRPVDRAQSNEGFFLDGDNVLVASEGEIVKSRYLIVELTPNGARLEDVQLKKSQNLPIVPEAKDIPMPGAAAVMGESDMQMQ